MDISHWEGSFDPDQAIHGLIDFAIFKATEGTTWIDDVFEKNYQASVGKVPIIGAYHYLRSGMSGRTQADHFTSIVGAKQIDILVCDFESSNNQMNDAFVEVAQEFGYYVKLWKPNCKLLFYTNPSTYDNVVYPGSIRSYGKDVFTEQPWDGFWVAQYYLSPSPDKDPAMPKTRKDWAIWQYSEAGDPDQHGTEGWVDQNVFNGDVDALSAWIGVDIPTQPPVGDPKMYVYKIPQSDIVRAYVTGYSTKKTVAEAAADFHATVQPGNHSIVINGDGWNGLQSNSIWWSDGKVKNSVQLDWRPRVVFDKNHKMTMRFKGIPYYWPDNLPDWNTFSLTRRLVIGGAINPAFGESGELNARCGFGITANNEFVIVGADGDDAANLGVTVTEIGEALIAEGVIEGGDGDGGGSFTLAYDGIVVNDWYNDGLPMRSVINHLCLEIQGDTTPPPSGDIAYFKSFDSNDNVLDTWVRQL